MRFVETLEQATHFKKVEQILRYAVSTPNASPSPAPIVVGILQGQPSFGRPQMEFPWNQD